MEVQVFMMPETEELAFDNDSLEKWKEKVFNLGLEGQSKSLEKKNQSPNVFMPINQRLYEAICVLCPKEAELKKYSYDTIPLQALEAAELAIKNNYFQKIVVRWDDVDKDPVMLGLCGYFYFYTDKGASEHFSSKEECEKQADKKTVYFFETERFLIARWGAEAKTISQLILDAKERFISQEKSRLTKALKDLKRELEDIELTAQLKFG
jgi:hypothetical protein